MEPPRTLTTDDLNSTELVYPAFIDKLRVVFQQKLGWGPLQAREFFEPWKRISKRNSPLQVGFLLRKIYADRGIEAATVAHRAIWWFKNEPALRRAKRAALKAQG